MTAHYFTNLSNFLAYFGVSIALITVFLVIYNKITPYHELELIRSNNTAAAMTLSGSLLGFALPVANIIPHSENLLDLLFWGLIASSVQLLAYYMARVALPQLTNDIPAGKMASATFLAALSVGVGIINAACMGY